MCVAGAGINLVSPPSGNVAPPGYYMLFVLNSQGVPSVSKWVRIDPSAPDRPEMTRCGVTGTKKSSKKQRCRHKRRHRRKYHRSISRPAGA